MEYTFQNGQEIYQRTKLQVGPLYLSSQSFKESTHHTSRIYSSEFPLTSIYFTATESVPAEWITADNGLSNDNFLRYWLLIGNNEYRITPGNRNGEHPIKYYINSNASDESRQTIIDNEGAGFIDTVDPVTTWQLKSMITRPSNAPVSYTHLRAHET